MLYNTLKIIHILSGSVVFCTLIGAQSYGLWQAYQPTVQLNIQHLNQKIVPLLILGILFQILSGFSLISLHHLSWQALWIKAALVGTVLLLINGGVFLSLVSLRGMQTPYGAMVSLGLSLGILSALIYFMANQIT